MSTFWEKGKWWVGGIVGLILVIAGLLYFRHLYLLNINRGSIIRVSGKPILKLGLERKSVIPLELTDAFKLVEAEDGRQFKTPKYENNALFQNEINGTVYTSDISTGEIKTYQWNKNTTYTCGTKELMAPPAFFNLEVDPKRDLENYFFVIKGDTWEGRQGNEGLAMFRQDVSSDDPVKLYTTNADSDASGRKALALVVLFTSHEACTDIKANKEGQ